MSNYQTRLGMPSLASEVFFLEVSQKVDESSDTSTSFAQKFNDQDTSDFTVKCQDKSFYVHQMILKERSEYFSMILRNDCIENQKKELTRDRLGRQGGGCKSRHRGVHSGRSSRKVKTFEAFLRKPDKREVTFEAF